MSRPLPYKFANGAVVLGHYKTAQISGAIAATPTALDHWARIRWAPSQPGAKLVLTRLACGLSVSGAITTAIQFVLDASIARAFTVDHTTAITKLNLSGGSGRMHPGMSASQMGAAGPGICTTAPCTGQTLALDDPFAVQDFPLITAVTATGTAILLAVGIASGVKDLYRWDGNGEHPPTLTSGEGIVVRSVLTGHATGTLALRCIWEWAEVLNPFGND
jgi:hypothetical protein